MHKKSKKAFTLVELIVVITILAILGTIAFISLQGYSKDTRNSVRLSDLSNINKTLGIQMVTAGKVQIPDNYVEITASGTVLNYQGEAGETVLNALGVSNGGKDPKDETYYIYSTNTNRTKYQLLGFMEGDAIAGVSQKTFAVTDLSERAVKVYGDDVGILLNNVTNLSVTTDVDVVNTSDIYNITFTDESLIEGSGTTLFSNIYNRNESLLDDKELAKLDNSLVGYWDMESLSGSVLRDFSGNGNDGICYNSGTVVNCGSSTGPQILNKSMSFDGIDDHITIEHSDSISLATNDPYSISYMFNVTTGDWMHLLGKGPYRSSYDHFLYSNGLYVYTKGGNSPSYIIGNIYNLNEWVYLVQTYDSDNKIRVYINGILVGTSEVVDTIANSADISIGMELTRRFKGLMDEVRIYNRALSENEIQTLYNSTK